MKLIMNPFIETGTTADDYSISFLCGSPRNVCVHSHHGPDDVEVPMKKLVHRKLLNHASAARTSSVQCTKVLMEKKKRRKN